MKKEILNDFRTSEWFKKVSKALNEHGFTVFPDKEAYGGLEIARYTPEGDTWWIYIQMFGNTFSYFLDALKQVRDRFDVDEEVGFRFPIPKDSKYYEGPRTLSALLREAEWKKYELDRLYRDIFEMDQNEDLVWVLSIYNNSWEEYEVIGVFDSKEDAERVEQKVEETKDPSDVRLAGFVLNEVKRDFL